MQTIDETYRQRLRMLIDEFGGQVHLAAAIGKSTSQISQWLNASPDSKTGKPRTLKPETAREIEKAVGKPRAWFDQPVVADNRANVSTAPDVYKSVPLISWVQAGDWAEAIDLLQTDEGERVFTQHKPRRHTFALRVTGDSMEPEFTDGDIIIVEPDEATTNGCFVVVRQDGNTTFKKLVLDGTMTYLKPLNEKYSIVPLKEDAVICGVVVEKSKRY